MNELNILYIIADLIIWGSYFFIGYKILRFIRKRPGFPVKNVFKTAAFVVFLGGLTYLIDALQYVQSGLLAIAAIKVANAIVSLSAVMVIIRFFPTAIAMKTPAEFENELAERRKSEQKFMSLLESAPDSMIITGSDGNILMVNAQTENIFGFSREEIIGKKIEILIPSRYHSRHAEERNAYTENPRTRPMGNGLELFGSRKDGTEFPVEVSLSPLKISDPEETMVIAAVRDISRQKLAEKQIRQLNDNLEHMVADRTSELEKTLESEKTIRLEMHRNQTKLEFFQHLSEVLSSTLNYCDILGILSKTLVPEVADCCVVYENADDGTLKLLVLVHRDEKKNSVAFDLFQNYPPSPVNAPDIYDEIRNGKPQLYSEISDELLYNSAKDQDHLRLLRELEPKSAIVVPLTTRNKVYGALLVVITESDRRYDERELNFVKEIARRTMLALENARLYEESLEINTILEKKVSERTSALETINREMEAFSYSVSHDLRAPLRSIEGFSDKLLKNQSIQLDPQSKDSFMRIIRATRNMHQLIDDLLKLSRLATAVPSFKDTDLTAIADTIVNELKSEDPSRNSEIIIERNVCAKVDRNLIKIALQNLFDNAWKYSRTRNIQKIFFGQKKMNGENVFYINDNGVGFDMQYADRLFKSFQRLHSSAEFEGTGIGLTIVQRIIQRHNGKIWVESEVNKGTTFYFTVKTDKDEKTNSYSGYRR